MNDKRITERCDICGRERQMGPHIYELRKLSLYDLFVCKEHIDANHDGWAPINEDKLLAKLRAGGKPEPERLENGLLPLGV